MERIWRDLAEKLRASEPYRRLDRALGAADRLPLPAAAWVAELLAEERGRPLLVLVPRESDALAWLEASRLFGRGGLYFSAPALTPYHAAEVSLLVRAQEALALDALLRGEVSTLVATPRALFRRLPTAEAFGGGVVELAAGGEAEPEGLAAHLAAFGYERRDLVSEVGEFAVRGGVFDLYPPGEPNPLRLDLFGDTVESLRRFSPDGQRSLEEIERARVLPLTLFRAGAAEAERLAARLAESAGDDLGIEGAERIEALRRKGRAPGWENELPALADETLDLASALGEHLGVAVDPAALAAEVGHYAERLTRDWELRLEQRRPALAPERLEQRPERVAAMVAACELAVGGLTAAPGAAAVDFAGSSTDLFHGQLPRFPREVETAAARRERLLVVSAPEHRRRVERLCETYDLGLGRGGVEIVEGELERGFRLPAAGVVVYGEPQLFGRAAPEPAARRPAWKAFVTGLRDLRVGDYVVHSDHGIGRFAGLRTVGEEEDPVPGLPPVLAARPEGEATAPVEVMEIAYAGERSLLLPLARLDLVQKYGGIEGTAPRLDDLGGTSWNRTKQRVREGMRKMAGDLLRLYAERRLARAQAMPAESDLVAQFESAFAFEETSDQLAAIAAIRADLGAERPMDRLLCGDVGFGKTEVAMRAAFKVVDAGYQVALLAPTTILADQHLETFRERMADFPVRIEMLSRFRTAREIRDVRERLERGEVDILIGTHRLLSRDIRIPRLGLLVVDEEQRFGVAQKERLKELKKNVHVLALSATPVPRTLQLSLAGVRDLSVIETPPRDRLAVETVIVPFSGELVREAVEAELERGGQIYYVYNQVESIEKMAAFLRELLPHLKLTVGHGQMEERELARRMHAFKRGEYELLLASTIIENGIDISNANTMLVHRADRFGLAQLYQLRGRVGRGSLLAYCYLMTSSDRVLTERAGQRLAAIREFSQLGAGFRVAARDLEIRGAGNLLGAEQSGHIAAVGMETYLKMLEDTVRELRGEAVEEAPSTAIDLPLALHIPTGYVDDANLRMDLYRRIASGESPSEEIVAELRDRFGAPPDSVLRLIEVAELKRLAERLRVQSISARGARLQLRLRRDARIDVERLIAMVSERPGASFTPTGVLTVDGVPPARMVPMLRETLEGLAQ